jgi:hypothetical protein
MTEDIKFSIGTSEKITFKDSNIFSDSKLKLPEISPIKGSIRPRPYSIYNVTQKGS